MKKRNLIPALDEDEQFDLSSLLHPTQAFGHPSEVVNDCDLTLSEKRAILASWASDACAVEANPGLRRTPGNSPVPFDDIVDALRELDRQAADRRKPIPHYRRVLERRNSTPLKRASRSAWESRVSSPLTRIPVIGGGIRCGSHFSLSRWPSRSGSAPPI
jgi:hypothetical protein